MNHSLLHLSAFNKSYVLKTTASGDLFLYSRFFDSFHDSNFEVNFSYIWHPDYELPENSQLLISWYLPVRWLKTGPQSWVFADDSEPIPLCRDRSNDIKGLDHLPNPWEMGRH